jgi:hypothetical protein
MVTTKNQYVYSSRARSTFRTLALALVVLLLGACDLDTSAIAPWDTGSTAFVCPGDPATLFWDTGSGGCIEGSSSIGGGGCPDINVSIISAPPTALTGGHATSIAASGSMPSLPITGLTTFTFSGTVDRVEFGPYENTTDVLLPDRLTTVPAALAGTCTGWETVSLAAGDFRSEGVRVVSIRNVNSFEIDLFVYTSVTDPLHYYLRPGESTPEFEETLGNKVTSATATRRGFSFTSVTCDTIASYPPAINLSIDLTCGTLSASEAIVIAPPGEEDEQPPEILIPRDTLCYAGPGDLYPVVGSLLGNSTALVQGIGADSNWLVIENPRLADVLCWVGRDDVEEPQGFDLAGFVVFPLPPLPTATPKPEKAVGCLVYDQQNKIVCVPRACTPNDQPGGSCTP